MRDSFYFQPHTPQNKSHREEAILVKDLVRDACAKAVRNGNHAALREDLEKVLTIARAAWESLARQGRFCLREQGIWRELDVPPRPDHHKSRVNSRFHLRPLVDANSRTAAHMHALVNRKKARIFELQETEITQKPDLESGHHPRSRGAMFPRLEAGHRERHVKIW